MLLPWLTCAALLAAASAADATPEELFLLDSQSTTLPHRLLQLLADSGQLQERQRRLRQAAGFKPWSGKRSVPTTITRDEAAGGQELNEFRGSLSSREVFQPWTGKRSGFKPWTGKRNGFKPWTGKRGSFKPWTGKRDSFKPWTGKRGNFKPWTGKRDNSFKPWTGKRDNTFKPWKGKRDDPEECIETEDVPEPESARKTDIGNMVEAMEDFVKRVAARSGSQPKDREVHVVRQRFKPWSGKRSPQSDDTHEDDDQIQF